jgi:hypothetical protein
MGRSKNSIAARMISTADASEITKYGIVFPTTYDTVLMGAMRTCSHVPRSFSRTIESDVEITPLIITMNPIKPGTRNNVLLSSGLYQMRGSTLRRAAPPRPCSRFV